MERRYEPRVLETCGEIRFLGRQGLRGFWLNAIVAVLIFQLISGLIPTIFDSLFSTGDYIVNTIVNSGILADDILEPVLGKAGVRTSTFSQLYNLLITGPITIGISSYFIVLVRRRHSDYGIILSGFKLFAQGLGMFVLQGILVWASLLPSLIVLFVGMILWSRVLLLIGLLLMLLVVVPMVLLSQSWLLLADNNKIGVINALRTSASLMRKNFFKYILLMLSFIGWFILAIIGTVLLVFLLNFITLGAFANVIDYLASLVFAVPLAYMYATSVQFFDLLTGRLRLRQDNDFNGQPNGFQNMNNQYNGPTPGGM